MTSVSKTIQYALTALSLYAMLPVFIASIAPVLAQGGKLSPGAFEWKPELALEGPVVTVVSIPDQEARVYRNGVLIGRSSVSTGKAGHETPVGVFTILQKDEDHRSNLYEGSDGKGAAMPFMERLTWDGIALHAGNVTGYPASHGCIRLPLDFAKKLYEITHIGTPIIVADTHSDFSELVHTGLVLPSQAEEAALAAVRRAGKKRLFFHHRTGDHKPASLIISLADKTAQLLENGEVVATEPLKRMPAALPKSDAVYILHEVPDGSHDIKWFSVGYHHNEAIEKPAAGTQKLLDQISLNSDLQERVRDALHPGFSVVVTTKSAGVTTRSAQGFTVVRHGES